MSYPTFVIESWKFRFHLFTPEIQHLNPSLAKADEAFLWKY